MLFFNKKRVADVDVDVKEQIRILKARLTRLEAEILDIATAQDIIRNKVLRKIQTKKEKEVDEDLIDEAGFLKTN